MGASYSIRRGKKKLNINRFREKENTRNQLNSLTQFTKTQTFALVNKRKKSTNKTCLTAN